MRSLRSVRSKNGTDGVQALFPGGLRALSIDVQDLDPRRRGQHLAEGVHPVAGLLARPDAAVAELVELVELLQFDLELQRGAVAMAAGQWHQQARIEAVAAGGLDLAADEIERTLPV